MVGGASQQGMQGSNIAQLVSTAASLSFCLGAPQAARTLLKSGFGLPELPMAGACLAACQSACQPALPSCHACASILPSPLCCALCPCPCPNMCCPPSDCPPIAGAGHSRAPAEAGRAQAAMSMSKALRLPSLLPSRRAFAWATPARPLARACAAAPHQCLPCCAVLRTGAPPEGPSLRGHLACPAGGAAHAGAAG